MVTFYLCHYFSFLTVSSALRREGRRQGERRRRQDQDVSAIVLRLMSAPGSIDRTEKTLSTPQGFSGFLKPHLEAGR